MRILGVVVMGFGLLACGGDEEVVKTRTVRNNNACVPQGAGGLAGDRCESADDCALIACCTCPDGTTMFSAAACTSTCLSAEEACEAALDSRGIQCD